MIKAIEKDFELKEEYHFNDLPGDIYVELDREFREILLKTAVSSIGLSKKSDVAKVLNTYYEQAQKIWKEETRLTINQLEYLRKLCNFTIEEVEKAIKSLGIRSDNKKRIYDPKLPFSIKDFVYVYSHLVFDGCVSKRYSYFLAYEKELLDYHVVRLKNFGRVDNKFFEKDKQLYIPHVIIHIIRNTFGPNSFKSLEAKIPKELKELATRDIEIANEIIKAAITDDGWIEDRISFSVANEHLSKDVWEIAKAHYDVGKFPDKPRERIGISGKPAIEWKWSILSSSMKKISENIKFPLSHKQERLEFAIRRQNRQWYKRKPKETRKLLIKSLLEKPKSTKELCFELNIRSTSILNLINGIHCNSQNTKGLKELGIVDILEYRTNTPGERTGKFQIYFVKDKEVAQKFME